MTGQRRAQQQDCDGGAGSFPQPHAEIKQRVEVECAKQFTVAGFGRDMPCAAVIQ
jgi:hypothetical protein